ncbi:A24 family peptidase [Vibrio sp. SCSIO 43136]|uniref:prepilin peptidase n=1 Tax=Vibrio sp. SCSIO 43136 TaxID=2819101 RepID=UPI002074F1E6|nr:A24 family peptidase [Vibrio sp. SCSIO 43136]USD64856.1 prepilin peptidase [Vibrio sp. SCSIO 43136]
MAAFDIYPWLYPLFAGLFGLIIGSFLNVVILRLPVMMEHGWKKEFSETFPELCPDPKLPEQPYNLSTPRSHCPSCKTPVRAIDNIPVISWLLLKGKCRKCQTKISWRYPAIELLTAITCATVAATFPLSYFSIALLFFTFVLITATFIDLDTLLLPDQLTLPLTWAGIALALSGVSPVTLQDSVIGAMAGYVSLWSVYWLFKVITGKEGMGYGDFKLLAALGAWLGWQSLPMIILLSSLVGVVFGLIQLRLQKKGIEQAFPFGPYLAIAGWCSLIFGEHILGWYFAYLVGV